LIEAGKFVDDELHILERRFISSHRPEEQ